LKQNWDVKNLDPNHHFFINILLLFFSLTDFVYRCSHACFYSHSLCCQWQWDSSRTPSESLCVRVDCDLVAFYEVVSCFSDTRSIYCYSR